MMSLNPPRRPVEDATTFEKTERDWNIKRAEAVECVGVPDGVFLFAFSAQREVVDA